MFRLLGHFCHEAERHKSQESSLSHSLRRVASESVEPSTANNHFGFEHPASFTKMKHDAYPNTAASGIDKRSIGRPDRNGHRSLSGGLWVTNT
jgi:hypothetical protein